jgi:hypothetical protein
MKINLKKAFKALMSKVPTLAKLALGSRGEAVVETVRDVLGLGPDTTEEALAKAIEDATPEQIAKLREIDLMFARLDFEVQQAFLADTMSARELAGKEGTGRHFILTLVLYVWYAAMCVAFAIAMLTPEISVNKDLMALFTFVFGGLTVAFAAANAFWFGTTRSSSRKTDQIFELQKANGNN